MKLALQVAQRAPSSALIPVRSLHDLVSQAVPYEEWSTPIDPRLRQLSTMAFGVSLAFSAALIGQPVLRWLTEVGILRILGGHAVAMFHVLRWPLALTNVVAVALYPALWWHTEGLTEGVPRWHQAAAVLVAIGAIEMAILGCLSIVVAINLVFWVFVLVFVAMMALAALVMLLGMAAAAET